MCLLESLMPASRFIVRLATIAVCLCWAPVLAAQDEFAFWPGASYDPAIPTIESALGYRSGSRISTHAAILAYYEALADAAPDHFKTYEFAESWEGRKLIYGVLGSAENIARTDAIKAAMQALADPRKTSDGEARRLMEDLPAIVWLAHSVHGNEISGAEASMLTAYHLLAARRDATVDAILEGALVILVPMQNPDGRDRFIAKFREALGLEPQGSPLAAEHDEPWPGGRTNHYLFDLNRDWFGISQPEIHGQVKALREWLPLVFVDLHEMGSDSTYYFAPEAVPYNPHITAEQRQALERFGRNNAKWFDRNGFSYFTREVYDAFYPGYGASWPIYYGSIAMTYEQASSRGLVRSRRDETSLHYRQTVRRHFVAGVSTAETAAAHRRELLESFWQYGKSAIEEGRSGDIRAYLFPRQGDTSAVDKLVWTLSEQGVEIQRTATAVEVCGVSAPAGSYLVSLEQRAKRYLRNMLDPDVEIDPEFMKEQERRRKKDLPDEIYDVTAWSLPAMYNVDSVACDTAPAGFQVFVPDSRPAGAVTGAADPAVAFLIPWGAQAAARFLTAALRAGLRVDSSDKEIAQNGRTFPRGTLILRRAANPDDLPAIVSRIAAESGAEAVGVDTGWVEDGVNFGSRHVHWMKAPRVAVGWDEPTQPYSAGSARFVLERQYGYPVTPIRIGTLSSADLSGFHALVLPDGRYGRHLNKEAMERLQRWVQAGGVLVGVGRALTHLGSNGLLDVQRENLAGAEKEDKAGKENKDDEDDKARPGKVLASQADFLEAIQPDSELPDSVPGVIARANVDPDHWVTAGYGEQVHAIYSGDTIFSPIPLDKGVNAAYFRGPDELVASGYMWEENRKQLAYKPLVVVQQVGGGWVIGFTADPNFRAYLDGMNMLFLNAIFRGVAHASRPTPP